MSQDLASEFSELSSCLSSESFPSSSSSDDGSSSSDSSSDRTFGSSVHHPSSGSLSSSSDTDESDFDPADAGINLRNTQRSKKTVLVTGGAGFIGSHTAEALLKRGDDVVVIDEMNDYYDLNQKKENLEILEHVSSLGEHTGSFSFVKGDICDAETVRRAMEMHGGVDHICHLAARAGVRPSIDDPFLYIQSNVVGTVTLMELAAKLNVENFVYASSSSVYGGSKKEIFSESDVVDAPVSQYAASKKSTELFAATYHNLYGTNFTGLRFFTVYGPRGRPDMAPFKFMHRVLNDVTIDQYGDGTSERDYTYIDDIVQGVLKSLDKPLGCQVLNLGRGVPCSLKKFIGTIEKLCGKRADINLMPMQPGDVMRTCANTSKAQKLVGYRPTVPLEVGLENTLKWYKSFTGLH